MKAKVIYIVCLLFLCACSTSKTSLETFDKNIEAALDEFYGKEQNSSGKSIQKDRFQRLTAQGKSEFSNNERILILYRDLSMFGKSDGIIYLPANHKLLFFESKQNPLRYSFKPYSKQLLSYEEWVYKLDNDFEKSYQELMNIKNNEPPVMDAGNLLVMLLNKNDIKNNHFFSVSNPVFD